jgi:hypothetical protein
MAQGLPSHAALVNAVSGAIAEDGRVQEDASEGLRLARSRCRTLQGRLAGLLRGSQGEVSEKVGPDYRFFPQGYDSAKHPL